MNAPLRSQGTLLEMTDNLEKSMPSENASIGLKIRKRRVDFGLSLRDLAAKTNLTASFISQIERGTTNPSLNSLRKIAESLEVPLLYFLTDNSKKSPVVRQNARPRLEFEGFTVAYEMLTPDLSHKMEAVIGSLECGTGNVVCPLKTPTEEIILVLSGALTVGLEEETYLLNEGDSIYFEGSQLNELSCASDKKVTWVSVITPPVF
jgi:transcriptional regulator with XRE-family HTH domain